VTAILDGIEFAIVYRLDDRQIAAYCTY